MYMLNSQTYAGRGKPSSIKSNPITYLNLILGKLIPDGTVTFSPNTSNFPKCILSLTFNSLVTSKSIKNYLIDGQLYS